MGRILTAGWYLGGAGTSGVVPRLHPGCMVAARTGESGDESYLEALAAREGVLIRVAARVRRQSARLPHREPIVEAPDGVRRVRDVERDGLRLHAPYIGHELRHRRARQWIGADLLHGLVIDGHDRDAIRRRARASASSGVVGRIVTPAGASMARHYDAAGVDLIRG